jgi:hypothetical protein
MPKMKIRRDETQIRRATPHDHVTIISSAVCRFGPPPEPSSTGPPAGGRDAGRWMRLCFESRERWSGCLGSRVWPRVKLLFGSYVLWLEGSVNGEAFGSCVLEPRKADVWSLSYSNWIEPATINSTVLFRLTISGEMHSHFI